MNELAWDAFPFQMKLNSNQTHLNIWQQFVARRRKLTMLRQILQLACQLTAAGGRVAREWTGGAWGAGKQS